jgi:sialic acid synthase SpsE
MKIIADIGSNWFSLDDCLKSIGVLADLGVDAAKFQYFTFEKLYGYVDPYDHPKPGLYREWIDVLALECKKKRIEFMCSVFDSDDVKMISQHCTTFKIASPEISDIDLLKAYAEVFDPSKHEIYISTGCATIEDLKMADRIFEGKQVFMAC